MDSQAALNAATRHQGTLMSMQNMTEASHTMQILWEQVQIMKDQVQTGACQTQAHTEEMWGATGTPQKALGEGQEAM